MDQTPVWRDSPLPGKIGSGRGIKRCAAILGLGLLVVISGRMGGLRQGTLVTDEQLATFKKDVTTKQQVLDVLGGP